MPKAIHLFALVNFALAAISERNVYERASANGHNKLLDRSAGSVFFNLFGAAKLVANRRARSTLTFDDTLKLAGRSREPHAREAI